jgi:hypothetical protein
MALNAAANDVVDMNVTEVFIFDRERAVGLCRERDIPFSTLSTLMGRGQSTVRGWLRDEGDPPASAVSALALILGVHPGDLFRPAAEGDMAVEIRPLIQVRTPPRHRRRLHRLAEDVAIGGGRL